MKLINDAGLRKALTDFYAKLKDMFATKTEVYNRATTDAKLAKKSDTGHTHDDRYYTETEVNDKLATKASTSHNHDTVYTKQYIGTVSNFVDCTTPGTYFVGSETTLPNGPYVGKIYGNLVVFKGNGAGDVILQVFFDTPGTIFMRHKRAGKWDPWHKVFTDTSKPTWDDVTSKPSVFNPAPHSHDDKYYTEAEINTKVSALNDAIAAKAPTGHSHDNLYVRMQDKLLADNGDFNKFFTVGIYPVSGRNIKNAPYEGGDLWGVLEVIKRNGDLGIIQRYTGTNGVVYHRYITADSIVNISDNENIETFVDEEGTTWSIGGWIKSFSANCPPQWNEVTFKPATFPAAPHTHDDRYFTETEVDTRLNSKANKIMLDTVSGNGKFINEPVAMLGQLISSHKGPVKITLPVSWTSTMLGFDLISYNYRSYTGRAVYSLSGYNYNPKEGGRWVNPTVATTGATVTSSVRFGHDGKKCCIIIGDKNTTWDYPKFIIKNLMLYNAETGLPEWENGWKIELISDETGITGLTWASNTTGAHRHDSQYFRTDLVTITSGDFNNYYIDEGIHNVSSSTTIKNAPFEGGIWGILKIEVRSPGDVIQTFIDCYGKEWRRHRNGTDNIWSPWKKIFSESQKPNWSDINNKPSLAMASHVHDDRYFITARRSSVSDFNTATEPGMHIVARAETTPNAPFTGAIYGTLLVINRDAGIPIQTFIGADGGNIHTRHYLPNTKSWSPWIKMVTDSMLTQAMNDKIPSGARITKEGDDFYINW